MSRGISGLALLLVLVIASGVATVYVKHLSRALFVDLQALQQERDEMRIEWNQLQLEQSTWATHDRISSVATEKLELFMPPGDSVVVVNLR